jgi:hypothetical protein
MFAGAFRGPEPRRIQASRNDRRDARPGRGALESTRKFMNRDPIPDDIKRFILLAIPSIPHLEALLLLRGERDAPWDGMRVARRLYMHEKKANELLADLRAGGFLSGAGEEPALFGYAPRTAALRQMIDRLADIYARNLVDVTNLIHSKTGRKAQHFADAFKWRKDS